MIKEILFDMHYLILFYYFILGLECLVEKLNVSKAILNQICEGLLKPPDYDIRSELSQPLFRREITTLDDLQAGIVLTGN